MPLDPSIPLQAKGFQLESPLAQAGGVLNLLGLLQQQQLQRNQLEHLREMRPIELQLKNMELSRLKAVLGLEPGAFGDAPSVPGSAPSTTQLGPTSAPSTTQLGPTSAPSTTQLGPTSAPSTTQLGPTSAPSGMPGERRGDIAQSQLSSIGRLMRLDPARGKAALELWKTTFPEIKWVNGVPLHPTLGTPMAGIPSIPNITPEGLSATTNYDQNTGQFTVSAPQGGPETYERYRNIRERAGAQYGELRKLPLSNGREITLTQPELAEFNRTQQLPARYASLQSLVQPQAAPVATPSTFPVVTPQEQASRNATQISILQGELATETNPDNRAKIEAEIAKLSGPNPFRPAGANPLSPASPVVGMTKSAAEIEADKTTAEGRAKQQVEKPKAALAARDAIATLERLSTSVTDLANDKYLPFAVGVGTPASFLPGTPMAGVRARFKSLEAQSAFTALQNMRNSSPTGGALGNVSNFEVQRLENAMAALGRAQSAADIKIELGKIAKQVTESKARISQAYKETYGEDLSPVVPSAQTPTTPKVIDFGSLK